MLYKLPNIPFTFSALILLLLASCSGLKTDENIDADEVNKTIKSKKIKRVLEDEIVGTAYSLGQTAGDSAKALLPKNGDELCNMGDFTESMPTHMQEWVRMSVLRCKPTLFHHPKEKEIWKAYEQAALQGMELSPSIQRLGSKQTYKQLLYALPIAYKNASGQDTWAMLSIILDKRQVVLKYEREKK